MRPQINHIFGWLPFPIRSSVLFVQFLAPLSRGRSLLDVFYEAIRLDLSTRNLHISYRLSVTRSATTVAAVARHTLLSFGAVSIDVAILT